MSTASPIDLVDPLRIKVVHAASALVVKVGTRVLTGADGRLDRRRIEVISEQLCRAADSGRQVIMVSSGAVGAGVGKLGLPARPAGLAQLQAVAAIGQTDLIQAYESSLSKRGRHAAQVLLTASDLRRRSGYLHVRNALTQIHAFGAIAVVNENDSVAVGELMTTFGDNDSLAANVSGLLSDALLVILSDVDGLHDAPPTRPGSKRIDLVREIDATILGCAQDTLSQTSKGGMASKLRAAETATSYGHPTIIGPGRDDSVLDRILAGHVVGTLFLPPAKPIRGRRRWIGSAAHVEGSLALDDGAVRAVLQKASSLLAIGIRQVEGEFRQGAVVSLKDPAGREIARGLTNYAAEPLRQIQGLSNDRIAEVLGRRPYEVVVHRDNLVITSP